MKHYLLSFILLIVARFFLGYVIGSFAGIYAEIFSCVVLFSLLVYLLRKVPANEAVQKLDTKTLVFSSLSFSGILLVCQPLRFLIEYFLPELCLRANIFSRFGTLHPMVYFFELLLGTVMLSLSILYTARVTAEYHILSRVAAGGAAFCLFSLSLPSVTGDFVIGCFLIWFMIRYQSILAVMIYTFFYRILGFVVDYYEFHFSHTNGEMMGWLQTLGMLSLFCGIAVMMLYLETRFTHRNKGSFSFSNVIFLTSAALLLVIGCAVVQYSNL